MFWTRDTLVFRNGLDNEWLIRDFGENGGAEVVFFGEPGIPDPNNREETSPVQRDEPINAVIVAGTNPLGDGFFIPNALVSSRLADEGIDEFVLTANIDFFEGYGIGGDDLWVFESPIASIFASGDEGQDQLSVNNGEPHAQISLTGGGGSDEITVLAPSESTIVTMGNGGTDELLIQARHAAAVTVLGGLGRDRILVTLGQNTQAIVNGGRGRDRVHINAEAVQHRKRDPRRQPRDLPTAPRPLQNRMDHQEHDRKRLSKNRSPNALDNQLRDLAIVELMSVRR